MVYRRRDEWESDSKVYSPGQIEALANHCGIYIVSETNTHLLAYCPFHDNTDSPAFALDKYKGLWTCFNPSCGAAGNLEGLLTRLKGYNPFEIKRLILKYQTATVGTLEERLAEITQNAPEFVAFPEEPIARMAQDFWEQPRPQQYMINRGFSAETLEHFGIGYSIKKDMIVVPMHDPTGMLVGFVGRGIENKVFKNSDNLPKSKTAFNFHRAKQHGDTVIIVEASFDAMSVHQAGYPNVIALLGGHLSPYHIEQINKTFSTIIIMTDFEYAPRFDTPCKKCPREGHIMCQGHRDGRALGKQIVDAFSNKGKRILWAAYDDQTIYPRRVKDATDMTDEENLQCLRNAMSNFEYQMLNPEKIADETLASESVS